MNIFDKHGCLLSVALAMLALPLQAAAVCTAKSSTPVVDVGRVVGRAAPDSDVPGYSQLGNTRFVLLTFICENDRSALQLRFRETVGLGNNQLLRWDAAKSGGAMRMRLTKATADGIQVDMLGEDQVAVPALNVVKDGMIVSLNLAPLHKSARTFTVEMQITGLVDKSFVPTSATTFAVTPVVELINP
jgi:hypothetical protein